MPRSGKKQEEANALVLSFTAVRRALGLLGLALPPLLLLVGYLTGFAPKTSISAYFYSPGREILVGILCAMAVFLWSYLGYEAQEGESFPSDKLASRIAAAMVLVVAMLPCGEILPSLQNCTFLECMVLKADPSSPKLSGHLHLTAALIFFATLAVMCLVNFRRSGGTKPDREKLWKNRTFSACGLVIVACLIALILRGFQWQHADEATRARMGVEITVFVLESIAVWAFSIAWLIKGEAYRLLVKSPPKAA